MPGRVRAARWRSWSRRFATRPHLPTRLRSRRSRVLVFLGLLGPGLIAANAGNDAGGIATYSEVGAKYGYTLLWAMVLITVSLALVQRAAARMGTVTGKGLAELIRERYGIRWSAFATLAVLVANFGICISDFVGVGAALRLAGIPPQVSVPIAALGIWLIIVRGSYRRAERVFIWLTIPFFAYPIAAILAHPDWGEVGHALVVPQMHSSPTFLLLFVAMAGTTITPYMQLYLQSAVVERGATESDLKKESNEAIGGAIFADLVAAFIIIATGATLYVGGIHSIGSAADAAKALEPFAGQYAELLFGVGLLGASLLAAAILPIATSYVVAESLGFEKGIGRRTEEAPVFVGLITVMIVVSTIVAVVPGLPVISLLVGVQVVNGVLLPINLFFIWRLARSEDLMGEHRNKGPVDWVTAATVGITSTLSLILVAVTVLGL
ncbi:MAG: Nramp family divalent metal transporter [Actinobacteria bacterium]|nr:Nramp family divalent metal transporter [Actinomycetota bacterium]